MDIASNISLQYKIAGLFSDCKMDAIKRLNSEELKENSVVVALNSLTLDRDPKVQAAAKEKLEGVYSQV